jgi:hypothetical protein
MMFPDRSRISTFLKKLSPRLCHKAAPPNSPWVVVEFSNQDKGSADATGRANSLASDHSFDMAVWATRLRKEQAASNKNTQEQVYTNVSHRHMLIFHCMCVSEILEELHRFKPGISWGWLSMV